MRSVIPMLWVSDEIVCGKFRTTGEAKVPMADIPNFALIARRIASTLIAEPSERDAADVSAIVDELRAIWNARGAADLATIELELAQIGVKATGHLHQTLDNAVRALDR
jgi:hypothetical protein